MWWWIVGAVVAVLIAFICWIAWELVHAPMTNDVLASFILDDEKDESEDVRSNR